MAIQKEKLIAMSPEQVRIAGEIQYINSYDFLTWVRETKALDAYGEDTDVIELYSLSSQDVKLFEPQLDKILLKYWPDFKLISADSKRFAQSLFIDLLENYLSGQTFSVGFIDNMRACYEDVYEDYDYVWPLFDLTDWKEPEQEFEADGEAVRQILLDMKSYSNEN